MSHPPFDAAKAVTFDLAQGQVHLEDAPRRVLVPADALAQLCANAGADATASFARALGEPMGRRLARRLGDTGKASVEAVADHLGGELALAGLGSLGIERWGRALVFVVDQSPLAAAGDGMLARVLEAALAVATGSAPTVVLLGRDSARARFAVTGAEGATKLRGLLERGTAWTAALAELHDSASSRGGA